MSTLTDTIQQLMAAEYERLLEEIRQREHREPTPMENLYAVFEAQSTVMSIVREADIRIRERGWRHRILSVLGLRS